MMINGNIGKTELTNLVCRRVNHEHGLAFLPSAETDPVFKVNRCWDVFVVNGSFVHSACCPFQLSHSGRTHDVVSEKHRKTVRSHSKQKTPSGPNNACECCDVDDMFLFLDSYQVTSGWIGGDDVMCMMGNYSCVHWARMEETSWW